MGAGAEHQVQQPCQAAIPGCRAWSKDFQHKPESTDAACHPPSLCRAMQGSCCLTPRAVRSTARLCPGCKEQERVPCSHRSPEQTQSPSASHPASRASFPPPAPRRLLTVALHSKDHPAGPCPAGRVRTALQRCCPLGCRQLPPSQRFPGESGQRRANELCVVPGVITAGLRAGTSNARFLCSQSPAPPPRPPGSLPPTHPCRHWSRPGPSFLGGCQDACGSARPELRAVTAGTPLPPQSGPLPCPEDLALPSHTPQLWVQGLDGL